MPLANANSRPTVMQSLNYLSWFCGITEFYSVHCKKNLFRIKLTKCDSGLIYYSYLCIAERKITQNVSMQCACRTQEPQQYSSVLNALAVLQCMGAQIQILVRRIDCLDSWYESLSFLGRHAGHCFPQDVLISYPSKHEIA